MQFGTGLATLFASSMDIGGLLLIFLMGSVFFFGGICAFCWNIQGMRKGEFHARGGSVIYRRDEPSKYWRLLAINIFFFNPLGILVGLAFMQVSCVALWAETEFPTYLRDYWYIIAGGVALLVLLLVVLRRIGVANRYPCPYCGKRLPSDNAKQCLSCGRDWHNPGNLLRHGKPVDDPSC